jgi:ABC-2 type transport system ATP-binding protein
MIEVKNLTKTFAKQVSLDNVSLQIGSDEKVIVMGQNGAGKTTLVRTILGEYIPTSGSVSIMGNDPFTKREQALQNIGFVPQLPPPIKFSVGELIRYAQISSNAQKADVVAFCKKMDLDITSHMNKLFFKLSGGMKQKLLIAIALAKNPSIFIFDEPTANLDPKGRDNFYALLQEFEKDKLMIFISHRLEEVGHIVTRKVEMDLGKVIIDETI